MSGLDIIHKNYERSKKLLLLVEQEVQIYTVLLVCLFSDVHLIYMTFLDLAVVNEPKALWFQIFTWNSVLLLILTIC